MWLAERCLSGDWLDSRWSGGNASNSVSRAAKASRKERYVYRSVWVSLGHANPRKAIDEMSSLRDINLV